MIHCEIILFDYFLDFKLYYTTTTTQKKKKNTHTYDTIHTSFIMAFNFIKHLMVDAINENLNTISLKNFSITLGEELCNGLVTCS